MTFDLSFETSRGISLIALMKSLLTTNYSAQLNLAPYYIEHVLTESKRLCKTYSEDSPRSRLFLLLWLWLISSGSGTHEVPNFFPSLPSFEGTRPDLLLPLRWKIGSGPVLYPIAANCLLPICSCWNEIQQNGLVLNYVILPVKKQWHDINFN